eukprot:GFUD01009350.1.p1 GENE.GFUD01009350.1~~GFUD01009350.1.p1  ORF type:complete len:293 (+),score=86.16 GFUD01009350.1:53-880(+)
MAESEMKINVFKTIYLNGDISQITAPVFVGVGVVVLTTVLLVILYSFWPRRKNKQNQEEIKKEKDVNETNENCPGIDDEFEQINLHLQDDLKSCITEKVDSARKDILIKQKEMEDKIAKSKSDEEEELAIIESKYLAEKDLIEEKYEREINKVRNEFLSEIYEMKETIQSMKIVLASSDDDEEIVEKTRSELECPVCLEEMKPPRRIWQCSDGHPLCENCRKKPEMNTCPTCRKYLVGRSTIAEKLARALYAPHVGDEELETGELERKPKKIKLY